MEEKIEETRGAKSNRRRNILYALLRPAVLALVAARPISAAIQDGGGFHRPFGGRWGRHGDATPTPSRSTPASPPSGRCATSTPATEQQERVNKIVGGAIDELFRLKDRHQGNREAFAAQLGGASVDRAALEEIRKSEIALADEASKRLVQALADVSEVLTPEQRQALIERAHRHHAN